MKVKDFLENFEGMNHIKIFDRFSWQTKRYNDVRNVIKLREQLKELKTRLNDDDEVSLQGHKIACLLFEVSMEIKMLILDIDASYDDIIEYLSLASQYLYDCGRIINIEILCFENKLL